MSEGTDVGPVRSHAGAAGRLATFAATVALVPAAVVATGGTPAGASAQAAAVARTAAAPGTISTIAGGAGGPAKATRVALRPCGVVAGGGYLYINAGNTVRQVNATTNRLTTPAGTGSPGPLGDSGPATRASLNSDCGITRDRFGNVVIADTFNGRIRVVAAHTGSYYGQAMTTGHIYTVAGNGNASYSGGSGPAVRAQLSLPGGLAVDAAGNLVIADTDNHRVEVVAGSTGTFYGRAMTAGHIYNVAGGGTGGDGNPATDASLSLPQGVAVDASGNVVIADMNHNRIRVVAGSSGTFYGQAMTAGDIYTVTGTTAEQFSGDGGPGTSAALHSPEGVAVDQAGNLLISDAANGRIRMVTP